MPNQMRERYKNNTKSAYPLNGAFIKSVYSTERHNTSTFNNNN